MKAAAAFLPQPLQPPEITLPTHSMHTSAAQLVAIMKLLGPVTPAGTGSMAASLGAPVCPTLSSGHQKPWSQVLKVRHPNGKTVQSSFGCCYGDLLNHVLRWAPPSRYTSQEIIVHPFFDELKISEGLSWHRDLTDEALAVIGDNAPDQLPGWEGRREGDALNQTSTV